MRRVERGGEWEKTKMEAKVNSLDALYRPVNGLNGEICSHTPGSDFEHL